MEVWNSSCVEHRLTVPGDDNYRHKPGPVRLHFRNDKHSQPDKSFRLEAATLRKTPCNEPWHRSKAGLYFDKVGRERINYLRIPTEGKNK